MPREGIEPSHPCGTRDFESRASTVPPPGHKNGTSVASVPNHNHSMHPTAVKILALALLVCGEGIAIYAEMRAAREHAQSLPETLPLIGLMTVAGCLLIVGYVLGYRAYQNIWIVSVVSITSILVIEPILAYTIFQEIPTRGAVIGLTFGALGFAASLLL